MTTEEAMQLCKESCEMPREQIELMSRKQRRKRAKVIDAGFVPISEYKGANDKGWNA